MVEHSAAPDLGDTRLVLNLELLGRYILFFRRGSVGNDQQQIESFCRRLGEPRRPAHESPRARLHAEIRQIQTGALESFLAISSTPTTSGPQEFCTQPLAKYTLAQLDWWASERIEPPKQNWLIFAISHNLLQRFDERSPGKDLLFDDQNERLAECLQALASDSSQNDVVAAYMGLWLIRWTLETSGHHPEQDGSNSWLDTRDESERAAIRILLERSAFHPDVLKSFGRLSEPSWDWSLYESVAGQTAILGNVTDRLLSDCGPPLENGPLYQPAGKGNLFGQTFLHQESGVSRNRDLFVWMEKVFTQFEQDFLEISASPSQQCVTGLMHWQRDKCLPSDEVNVHVSAGFRTVVEAIYGIMQLERGSRNGKQPGKSTEGITRETLRRARTIELSYSEMQLLAVTLRHLLTVLNPSATSVKQGIEALSKRARFRFLFISATSPPFYLARPELMSLFANERVVPQNTYNFLVNSMGTRTRRLMINGLCARWVASDREASDFAGVRRCLITVLRADRSLGQLLMLEFATELFYELIQDVHVVIRGNRSGATSSATLPPQLLRWFSDDNLREFLIGLLVRVHRAVREFRPCGSKSFQQKFTSEFRRFSALIAQGVCGADWPNEVTRGFRKLYLDVIQRSYPKSIKLDTGDALSSPETLVELLYCDDLVGSLLRTGQILDLTLVKTPVDDVKLPTAWERFLANETAIHHLLFAGGIIDWDRKAERYIVTQDNLVAAISLLQSCAFHVASSDGKP